MSDHVLLLFCVPVGVAVVTVLAAAVVHIVRENHQADYKIVPLNPAAWFDKHTVCPKCRYSDNSIEYHAGGLCACNAEGEHMLLVCKVCGYRWTMKPLDAKGG